MVDAGDSKSPAARRAGSIPAPGTRSKAAQFQELCGLLFFSVAWCTTDPPTGLQRRWGHRFSSTATVDKTVDKPCPERAMPC